MRLHRACVCVPKRNRVIGGIIIQGSWTSTMAQQHLTFGMLYSIIHLERQFQLDSASFEGNNSWDYDRANLLQSNLTLHAALAIGQGSIRSQAFFGFEESFQHGFTKKKKKEKKMLRTYYSCNFVDNNNRYISRTRIFLFLLTKRRNLKIRLRRF